MGNCASLTDNLITGAILGATVLAGVGTGGAGFAVTGAAVGVVGATASSQFGFGVSPFDLGKSNCRVEKTAVINTFHQVVSYSIFKSIQNCSNSVSVRQAVSIKCHPVTAEGTVYEENQVCRQCYEDNIQGMFYQHQLQREAIIKDGTNASMALSIEKEYETLLYKLSMCGIRYCKACVLLNTHQSNILGNSTQPLHLDCLSNMIQTNQFATDFKASINQILTENTDILSAVSDALGTSGNNMNQIANNIVSKTTTIVNQDYLSQLLSNIQSQQIISITMSDGIVSGLTQESVYSSIAAQVTDSQIATTVLNENFISALANVLNRQTTLDKLGNLVYSPIAPTLQIISDVVRYIMYACIAVFSCIIALIIAYILSKVRFTKLGIAENLPQIEAVPPRPPQQPNNHDDSTGKKHNNRIHRPHLGRISVSRPSFQRPSFHRGLHRF